MNKTLDSLRRVVGGNAGAEHLVLHTCRLEGFGCEIVGSRSVAEMFRRAPFKMANRPHVVHDQATFAVIDATVTNAPVAFFADTYDGRIGRLWRIGPAAAIHAPSDPAISVAFATTRKSK